MSPTAIIAISIGYVAVLFLIAFYTERQSKAGRSLVNNPYIYSLSLAVYCTAWTFFGSVGKAAQSGIDFLPVYLGPTIAAILWWFVLRKIILISKFQRITSIADFISSRYGKSTFLGGLATMIAIFSIIPYISIQLKAVAVSFDILIHKGVQEWSASSILEVPFYLDSAWYIAIALAIFTILFGTRKLDPNERHEGLVAAVAFESLLKLVAFLTIGVFVTFGVFNGFGDLFSSAIKVEEIRNTLFLEDSSINGLSWFWLTLLSMIAAMFLPRQFHIAVVENTNPDFVKTAAWVFPLYLLLINIFVIPIATGGMLKLGMEANPDMFVLSIPIFEKNYLVALLVVLGGFSAATSMVIVAVTALSIMISNNLVMPTLLRSSTIQDVSSSNISDKLLNIRRLSVTVVLISAYGYFKFVSAKYTLVSIGLISFAGIAQFAPIILGGIFWKRATRLGAMAGLSIGFLVWAFCLPLPTLSEAGIFSMSFVNDGFLGIEILKPYSLFGLEGWDRISHGAFWSLLLNIIAYITVSLNTKASSLEVIQADLFVDIYKYEKGGPNYEVTRRRAKVFDIKNLLTRFLGTEKSIAILEAYKNEHKIDLEKTVEANEDLIKLVETHLSGSIGAASAKVILHSIVKEDPISLEEMFEVLEQTQEIIQYSNELELKSSELEATTHQLKNANNQLKELDRLKADFITTITHELRTPITSIKALSKILFDNPNLSPNQHAEFLNIIVSESERIARLVNQVLDSEKLQSLKDKWELEELNLSKLLVEVYLNMKQLLEENKINHQCNVPEETILVKGARDKLAQAIINLLSNAIKFCDPKKGEIFIRLTTKKDQVILEVQDNGMGISEENKTLIFERFTQLTGRQSGKPQGTGLGLAITKDIIEWHDGTIKVESEVQKGATFIISLPLLKKS